MVAGKIMSLWVCSSLSEVSWEGSAVLTDCLGKAWHAGHLLQLVGEASFPSPGT